MATVRAADLMYVELQDETGALVGLFGDSDTAALVAADILAEGAPHVLLQTFDDARRLLTEVLVSGTRVQENH